MKYIMFEGKIGSVKKLIPIIFPNELVHILIARAVMPQLREMFEEVKPVNAGSLTWPLSSEIHTGGESETMKLKGNAEDGDVIAQYDYFHGL